jgi:hypothetical protein
MAKYADYVQAQTVEDEIEEAATKSAAREAKIPEQFQGKDITEVVKSYEELKSMNDRQANELGELRKTTSQLTEMLQGSQQRTPAQPEPEPVTVDDLYANPEEAIARAVDKRVSAKLEELERVQQNILIKSEMDELERKFPGYREDAKSAEMQAWLAESSYRGRLAVAADQGDLQAAEDLFSMYYDLKGEKPKTPDPVRAEQLRQATLESGATEVHSPVEKFSRSKLELARRRAKLGDVEAEQYMKENGDAIFRAYQEGRIVD